MALITITNLTEEEVLLQELYTTLGGGKSITTTRGRDDLHGMPRLQQLWHDGTVSVDIASDTAEQLFTEQKLHDSVLIKNWGFETSNAGVSYIGGFYEFAATDDDFAPSLDFGDINRSTSAHFLVVTGAVTTDLVQVSISGTSITDEGIRTESDTEVITIPLATTVDSYFETSKKWNGVVSVQTTAGTAITCNYGFAKYHDHNNRNFAVVGLEALWSAEATDTTSDLALIHHKADGWTFNAASTPTPPTALARRSTDHGTENGHQNGASGAWKRTNLSTDIEGSDSEGILIEVTSGSAGASNQSFRALNFEVSIKPI